MNPPTKLQVFANFLPKRNVTTVYHLLYSPDLSLPDYLLFTKLKMKLKLLHFADVAEFQEAITDEIKTFQKEEFSSSIRKVYGSAKACIYAYMPMELILNKEKDMCLRFLKNQT